MFYKNIGRESQAWYDDGSFDIFICSQKSQMYSKYIFIRESSEDGDAIKVMKDTRVTLLPTEFT